MYIFPLSSFCVFIWDIYNNVIFCLRIYHIAVYSQLLIHDEVLQIPMGFCIFLKITLHFINSLLRCLIGYTAKLLFHQSPTRQSDYTVTTTVTMQSLFSSPWHCDYWTVTTSDTHVIRYPLPWGLCRNLSTRHLVGNCTVTSRKTLDQGFQLLGIAWREKQNPRVGSRPAYRAPDWSRGKSPWPGTGVQGSAPLCRTI